MPHEDKFETSSPESKINDRLRAGLQRWQELELKKEKDEKDRQKDKGGFGGFLGDAFELLATSPFPDIPILPDFIEDTLFSPIGLASMALAPITGGGSLVGRASLAGLSTAARAGVQPLGKEVAKRGLGELAFGVGAEGFTKVGEEVLPEDLPGILRTGLLLGSGALGGTAAVRAGRSLPVANFAKQVNLDPELQRILAKGENETLAWWQGKSDRISEDTINVGTELIKQFARVQLPLAQQEGVMRMLMNTDELPQMKLGLGKIGQQVTQRPILRNIAHMVQPKLQFSNATTVGLTARENTESTLQQYFRSGGEELTERFRRATNGLEQADLFDVTRTRIREFTDDGQFVARYKPEFHVIPPKTPGAKGADGKPTLGKEGARPPEAGYARDILEHPDRYDMTPEFRKIVDDTIVAVDQHLLPFKKARGADVQLFETRRDPLDPKKKIKEEGPLTRGGVQRWMQDPDEVANVLAHIRETGSLQKTPAEFQRSLTLRQGLEGGLTPKPQTFLDVYMDDALEEARVFAAAEGERYARARAGGLLGGTARMRQQQARELRRRTKTGNKNFIQTRAALQNALRGLRVKVGVTRERKTTQQARRYNAEILTKMKQLRIEGRYAVLDAKLKVLDQDRKDLERLLNQVADRSEATGERVFDIAETGRPKAGPLEPYTGTERWRGFPYVIVPKGASFEGELAAYTKALKAHVRNLKQNVNYIRHLTKDTVYNTWEKDLDKLITKIEARESRIKGKTIQDGLHELKPMIKEADRITDITNKTAPTREVLRQRLLEVERATSEYDKVVEFDDFLSKAASSKQPTLKQLQEDPQNALIEPWPEHLVPRKFEILPGAAAEVPEAPRKFEVSPEVGDEISFGQLDLPGMREPGLRATDKPMVPLKQLEKMYEAHRKVANELFMNRLKLDEHIGNISGVTEELGEKAAREYRETLRKLESSSSALEFGGQIADSVREMMLTADASAFTIQFLAAAFDRPINAAQNLSRAIYFVLSPSGFRTWAAGNMSGLADASSSGLNLMDHLGSQIQTTAVAGLDIKPRPWIERVPAIGPGVRILNDAMYGRGVTYLKYQIWQGNVNAMIASKEASGFSKQIKRVTGRNVGADVSDAEIKRIVAEHVNNTLGGQNMRKAGISRDQQNLEKMFILTPDYLRSTLGLGKSAVNLRGMGRDPKGALARRVLASYAGGAILTTAALTAIFSDKEPNLFDPTAPNWLQIRIDRPDGGTMNMSPFGRLGSLIRPVAAGGQALADGASIEDAGNEAFLKTMQYGRGRMASFPGLAVELAENRDFLGNPIATDTGIKGVLQRVEHGVVGALPISGQALLETGPGLMSGVELLGINAYSTSPQQNAVFDALAAAALNVGIPANVIKNEVFHGRNPLYAKSEGKSILDSATRAEAISYAAELSGVDEETVLEKGRDPRLLTPDEQHAADDARRDGYFAMLDSIRTLYSQAMINVQSALDGGQTTKSGAREAIKQFRTQRRAQQNSLASSSGFTEIIANLNDPAKDKTRNERDILRNMYFDVLYSPEFESIGPNGIEFNFKAQELAKEQLRQTIGSALVDEFDRERQNNLTPLERDLLEVTDLLDPYWRVADEQWLVMGGTEKTGAESAESLRRQNPGHWFLRPYDRRLQRIRRTMRIRNIDMDRALVEWYGRAPVIPNRFGSAYA